MTFTQKEDLQEIQPFLLHCPWPRTLSCPSPPPSSAPPPDTPCHQPEEGLLKMLSAALVLGWKSGSLLPLPALPSAPGGLRVLKRQKLFRATVCTGGHSGTRASLYFPKWLLSIISSEQHSLLHQKEKADTRIVLSEMRKTRAQDTY